MTVILLPYKVYASLICFPLSASLISDCVPPLYTQSDIARHPTPSRFMLLPCPFALHSTLQQIFLKPPPLPQKQHNTPMKKSPSSRTTSQYCNRTGTMVHSLLLPYSHAVAVLFD